MAIEKYKKITARCDKEGCDQYYYLENVLCTKALIEMARPYGWYFSKGGDIVRCPKHRPFEKQTDYMEE